jgi:hypothetical protein
MAGATSSSRSPPENARIRGEIDWAAALMTRFPMIFALAVVLTGAPAPAATHAPAATGTFSDLTYNDEGGDLLGTEIFILLGPQGYLALVQVAQGVPGPVTLVPVKVNGDRIAFHVPAPSEGEGAYRGRITKFGFEGSWTHRYTDGTYRTDPIHLKRKRSYWG